MLLSCNPGEPGPVQFVIDPSNNLSGAIFEGLDYEAIYILDSTVFGGSDWGRITTTVNGTWLSRAEFQAATECETRWHRGAIPAAGICVNQFDCHGIGPTPVSSTMARLTRGCRAWMLVP